MKLSKKVLAGLTGLVVVLCSAGILLDGFEIFQQETPVDLLQLPKYSVGKPILLDSGEAKTFSVDDAIKIVGYKLHYKSEREIKARIKINNFAKSSMDDMSDYVGEGKSTKEQAILWTDYIFNNRRWGSTLMANNEFSNPLLFFVNGGYGVCSDFSRAMAIALTRQNIQARVTHISGLHAVVEVWYDDAWHMFDPSEGVWFTDEKGVIVSVEQILNNLDYIEQMTTFWGRQKKNRDFLYGVYKNGMVVNLEYADSFMYYFQDENLNYTMLPGDQWRFFYNWKDKNVLANYKTLLLEIVNGVYESTISKNGLLNVFSRDVAMPHFINAVYLQSTAGCRSVFMLEYSLDKKKTWHPYDSCQDGLVKIETVFLDYEQAKAYSTISLRGVSLSSLQLFIEFQLGKDGVQPVVMGENRVQTWWPEEGGSLNFELLYSNE